MIRSRHAVAVAAAVCLAAVPAVVALGTGDSAVARVSADTTATDPTFARIDVDTTISGASFTSVGEVFDGEQDIVTSGYGVLDSLGRPTGGGTLQIYRPGATLADWTKVTVFGPEEGVVFPNATTIDDVDGDGDNDLILPSGYFFGTDPTAGEKLVTGAITWWENRGPDESFERHDVIGGQAGSYHGVQLVDLDGDGVKDLLSTSEEARTAGDLGDDTVETQFFKGRADQTFAAPVALSDAGGSQPVVYDMDADGDLDIVSSQYFHTFNNAPGAPTFLWLENQDADGTLTASDFKTRTIATLLNTATDRGVGMGFQIRPVPNFRKPGTVSWIGTNHVNRCTLPVPLAPIAEQVIEFTPGTNIRAQWKLTTLSAPTTPTPPCPADYRNYPEPEFSDQITARFGYGQGAPGVLGYGDIDGDGDVDLAVSGDGDRRLWWIEKKADGGTILHKLTDDGEYFGQAGGAVVADLDGDGVNEIVFSSYDQNTLAIWTPDGTVAVPVVVTSRLTATPATVKVKAGKKARVALSLSAAAGPRPYGRGDLRPEAGQGRLPRQGPARPERCGGAEGHLQLEGEEAGKADLLLHRDDDHRHAERHRRQRQGHGRHQEVRSARYVARRRVA